MIILTTHIHTYTSSFNRAFLMRSVVSVWFQLIKFSIGRSEWGKRTQQQPFHARKMHHFAKTGSGQTERKLSFLKRNSSVPESPWMRGAAGRPSSRLGNAGGKAVFFWSFPYVCPEPVLAKWCIMYINGAKSGGFTHLGAPQQWCCARRVWCHCRKMHLFFLQCCPYVGPEPVLVNFRECFSV